MIDKLPFLPDEHHYAIAAVAARSSQMEHMIEHTVNSVFAGRPETAEFLLKNTSSDRLVGLLQAALLDAHPRGRAQIEAMAAEITRLRTERNNILHWLWGKSEDPTKAKQGTIRPFREERTRELSAADIRRIADDMLKVSRDLRTWSDQALIGFHRVDGGMLRPSNETLAQRFHRNDWLWPTGPGPADTPPPSDPPPKPSEG